MPRPVRRAAAKAKVSIRLITSYFVKTEEKEANYSLKESHTTKLSRKRSVDEIEPEDEEDDDDPPVTKRVRKGQASKTSEKTTSTTTKRASSSKTTKSSKATISDDGKAKSKPSSSKKTASKVAKKIDEDDEAEVATSSKVKSEEADEAEESAVDEDAEDEIDEKPEVAAKARAKVQSTLASTAKDPYPDWKEGDPVPFAALCTTFSKIEMTTKRLEISAHCSLFLRQVVRLTPGDLLPTILLMVNKLAADYAGIELGIGESLIMKAIGESTGRNLAQIKSDQKDIGDLGLVAAKSRAGQRSMFKPKALTVRGVREGLMGIATIEGQGSQGRKVAAIQKLLSAADLELAGKGVDITKDKGGPSEAKYIVRMLEGKLRLGLAEKTVLVAVAQAMVFHDVTSKGNKAPTTEQLEKGERVLKSVYRYVSVVLTSSGYG